jgi:Arc/MetJ-type ribon-helix-helix transcriptional regulator
MRFAFSEVCREVSKYFSVVVVPTTFQVVSVVCQIFSRVPHQTHRYEPIKAVVEHKGLLRGNGWFSRQLFAFVMLASCTNRGSSCTFVHAPVTSQGDDAIRSVRPTRAKTKCRGIRLDELLIGRVERAAKEGGFSNPSAFIRAAIQRELAGRESEVEAAEDRIAASLDRLGREIRSIKLAQQALFAFVDSLVKTLLTCIAEPPTDAHDQAVAKGKFRYDRFLKSVGASMAGDSKEAMAELVNRGEQS